MKQLIFVLAMLVSISGIGQLSGNYNYDQKNRTLYGLGLPIANAQFLSDHIMTFEVKGLLNAEADAYSAIFNINQIGELAEDADRLVNERIAGMVEELKLLGIKEEEVFSDMISFVPVFEYTMERRRFSKTYHEVPAGFELQKNLHVNFTDSKLFDKIVTAAAKQEIYDLVKVDYFMNDKGAAYEELRKKAIDFMKHKLVDFEKLGVELDTVYHVLSEQKTATYPLDRYQQYQALSRSSIDAIKKRTTVNNIRQPKTMFYQKIPYDQFDVIVNPVIKEPVIQLTYDLKVKFIIKEPKPVVEVKREKEFVLVTPDGTTKTLKIE